MKSDALGTVLGRLRGLVGGTGGDDADRALLGRFARQGDQAAFAELVRRHGPMVQGVCRRLACGEADSDDVVQATFMVLARKAGSLAWKDTIHGWLHAVAYRLALKARTASARRRHHEREAAMIASRSTSELPSNELREVIDLELNALPEAIRTPMLLCYLQGHTVEEAARRLGWSAGMVKGRLERGRDQLRDRLARRGWPVAAPALATMMSADPAPAMASSLAESTTAAALAFARGGAAASSSAVELARVGLRSLALAQLRFAAAAALVLLCTTVTSVWAWQFVHVAAPNASPAANDERRLDQPPPLRLDRLGDPLPRGAIARIGTHRFWHPSVPRTLAVSDDGKSLATVIELPHARGDQFRVWSLVDGRERMQAHRDQVIAREAEMPRIGYVRKDPNTDTVAALSPDGSLLAVSRFVLPSRAYLRSLPDRFANIDVTEDKPLDQVIKRIDPRAGTPAIAARSIPLKELLEKLEKKGPLLDKSTPPVKSDTFFQLWDVATGKPLHVRGAAWAGLIGPARFTRDGTGVLACDDSHAIRLCDLESGAEVRRFQGHRGVVCSLDISPDGKLLASGSEDLTVRFWELATGKLVRTVDVPVPGPWLPPVPARPFDDITAEKGKEVLRKPNPWLDPPVHGRLTPQELYVRFSPDGKSLATWPSVHLVDVQSGTVKAQPADSYFIEFPTGKQAEPESAFSMKSDEDFHPFSAAVAFRRGKVEVTWPERRSSLEARNAVSIFARGGIGISAVAPLDDGDSFAVVGFGPYVDFIGGERAQSLLRLSPRLDECRHFAFAPDGDRLGTAGIHGDRFREWNISDGSEATRPTQIDTFLVASPDGSTLLGSLQPSAHEPPYLAIWDRIAGRELCRLESPASFNALDGSGRENIRLDRKSLTMATAVKENGKSTGEVEAVTWDLASGKIRARHRVPGVYFSLARDGKSIAACGHDPATIVLSDVVEGRELRRFVPPPGDGAKIAWEHRLGTLSPDGSRLLAQWSNQTHFQWTLFDTGDGRRLAGSDVEPSQPGTFHVYGFSSDGGLFALRRPGSAGVSLHSSRQGKFRCTLPTGGLTFSPDGSMVAAPAVDGGIRLWETATGRERARFEGGHRANIRSITFSPDSRRLATYADDRTVLVWDLRDSSR